MGGVEAFYRVGGVIGVDYGSWWSYRLELWDVQRCEFELVATARRGECGRMQRW